MNKKRTLTITLLIVYLVLLATLLLMIIPPAMDVITHDILNYMNAETALISVLMLIGCLTVVILSLSFYTSQKTDKEKNNRFTVSRIDDDRNYLEQQINDLNKKLISTEERLIEAYHLVLSSQSKQKDRTGKISTTAFLDGFGIDVDKVDIQGDLAFILTPFHEDFSNTYDVVCSTCQQMKLKPMRGDEKYIASDVLKHIINQVVKSRLVIAILDGRNPNVFYELGIVHSLNKPTILLANINTNVPFDLQNQYLVLYENEIDLREKLESAILNTLTLD